MSKKIVIHDLSNHLIVKGTLILTITGIMTRFIGFYNRIFLSDLIGSKELGVYQLVLPIYILAFAICTYGNELALTKLVSQYNNKQVQHVFFRCCTVISFSCSIIISFLLYCYADFISIHFLNTPDCAGCIRILCYGIPSISLKGCIHGYFLGKQDSSVHGISDLIEQTMKILSLYILITLFFPHQKYNAEFAIYGIVCGEYISLLYSLYRYVRFLRTEKNNNLNHTTCTYTNRELYKIFMKNAFPMTLNRFAITLIQSVEAILIPAALLAYYHNENESLSVYGIIMGISFPFIMFPATITNAMSSMLMPAVSCAKGENNNKTLQKIVEESVHFCLLIGIFSAIFFFIAGKEIGICFFHNETAGVYLQQLSFLCPLIYLSTTFASILNGLGDITRNLTQTLIATAIRIFFILFLIPKWGTNGYILGLFFSYLILSYMASYRVTKQIHFQISFVKSILLPVIFFLITGYSYYFCCKKSMTMFHSENNIFMLFIFIALYSLTTIIPVILTTYKVQQQRH